MSMASAFNWDQLLFLPLLCPSLLILPALVAIPVIRRRISARGKAALGALLHLVAILAVGAWYGMTLHATANDVSAGGGYVFLGFIVVLPLNVLLAAAGLALMLVDRTPPEPPPIPQR